MFVRFRLGPSGHCCATVLRSTQQRRQGSDGGRTTEPQRLGFLVGEIVVPENFNRMGEVEIAALRASPSSPVMRNWPSTRARAQGVDHGASLPCLSPLSPAAQAIV
jgi:hypothetical protein